MQYQDPLAYKSSFFFHLWNSAQSHICYMQGLPEDFSGYCNKILVNAQNFKEELQKISQNGNNLMIEKQCIGDSNEPSSFKAPPQKKQSIKRLKVSENTCFVQKVTRDLNNNHIQTESKLVVSGDFGEKHDVKEISFNFVPNENKCDKYQNNEQNNEKIIQKFTLNQNPIQNSNIVINQTKEINNKIESSPPSKKNSKEGDLLFPQNNHVKKKSSNMSFALNPPTISKCKRQSSFSIKLSQPVDHEKEKRKSQMQKQLLSEKSFDEMMTFLQNSQAKCQNNNEGKNEKKVEENNQSEDVFFSILQQDSDSLHNLLQDSDENVQPIDFFPTLSKKPKNPENYELTDYSSNSSSADGSYDYEWREMAISDEKDNNIENSLNFTNHPNFNDPCSNNFQYPFVHQPTENDLFFSQKTNVFGIFKNNLQQEQVHDYNTKGFFGVSQQPIGFSTINFQKNPMDNQKRVSNLMLSPQKKEIKFEKKLVCTRKHVKKIIPNWASDMNAVKNKLLEQRNVDPNTIFGSFVVDNLDLRTLFNEEDLGTYEKRGSSANWKHDQVTPDSFLGKKSGNVSLKHLNENSFLKKI